jgi:hypothetical protein
MELVPTGSGGWPLLGFRAPPATPTGARGVCWGCAWQHRDGRDEVVHLGHILTADHLWHNYPLSLKDSSHGGFLELPALTRQASHVFVQLLCRSGTTLKPQVFNLRTPLVTQDLSLDFRQQIRNFTCNDDGGGC